MILLINCATLNPSGASRGICRVINVNAMAVDILALCITSTSAMNDYAEQRSPCLANILLCYLKYIYHKGQTVIYAWRGCCSTVNLLLPSDAKWWHIIWPKLSLCTISLKIIFLKSLPHLPGDNTLKIYISKLRVPVPPVTTWEWLSGLRNGCSKGNLIAGTWFITYALALLQLVCWICGIVLSHIM